MTKIAVPRPDAGQGLGLAVTDTTVYFGCGSSSGANVPAGLFAIDRDGGEVADILPPEMADDRWIHKIEVFEDILVVAGARVGVMDLVSGDWRFARVGGRQRQFTRIGDTLIAASSAGLHEMDLKTWRLSHVADPGARLGDYQGIALVDGLLVGAMSGGHLWSFDRKTGETEVYVKDMVAVGDTMYMATYAPAALWKHRHDANEPPRQIRRLPPSQNRPTVVCWDDVNELIVIGVRSATGGGSLCFFDPVTEEFTAHIDPLGDSQWVFSAAPADGLVYIAGAIHGGRHGDIAAWDPVSGRELWRMENPLGEGGGVSTLAAIGDRLYGMAIGGPRFFAVDISPEGTPELIHEADLVAFAPEPTATPRLLVNRGTLYGISLHSLFRIDPETFEPELLVKGLDAEWYSGPRIAAGEDDNR